MAECERWYTLARSGHASGDCMVPRELLERFAAQFDRRRGMPVIDARTFERTHVARISAVELKYYQDGGVGLIGHLEPADERSVAPALRVSGGRVWFALA